LHLVRALRLSKRWCKRQWMGNTYQEGNSLIHVNQASALIKGYRTKVARTKVHIRSMHLSSGLFQELPPLHTFQLDITKVRCGSSKSGVTQENGRDVSTTKSLKIYSRFDSRNPHASVISKIPPPSIHRIDHNFDVQLHSTHPSAQSKMAAQMYQRDPRAVSSVRGLAGVTRLDWEPGGMG
jgi:hypothetical protein